jgi:hypothetical protein
MNLTSSVVVTIDIKGRPGEILLRRPYASPDVISLASCRIQITERLTDGGESRAFTHLHPQSWFRGYRERREGGWGLRSPAGWPKFMLRVEMLPDYVIDSIKTEYADRYPLDDVLPPWSVVNGEDMTR